MGTILLHETAGTAMLLLLGVGVVANAVLAKTKGNAGGWLMISLGWGLAVFAGVYVAYKSGAHLNPA
ncbi:aquaporin, partial [Mycobacterium tuberculosis]|nr:aquaporin [Mycobacterium tuberculosis]